MRRRRQPVKFAGRIPAKLELGAKPAGLWRDRDRSGAQSPQGINALVARALMGQRHGRLDPAA